MSSVIGLVTGNLPKRVTISHTSKPSPGVLELDATIEANASRKMEVTKNPVEGGGNIADHAILQNLTYTIKAVVSEAPISVLQSFVGGIAGGAIGNIAGGAAGGAAAIGTAVGAVIGSAAAGELSKSPNVPASSSLDGRVSARVPLDRTYPKLAYDWLMSLQQDRILISVESRFHILDNLMITELGAPIVIERGRSVEFSMVCEQVQIIDSATIQLSETQLEAEIAPTAASSANLGTQSAGAATSSQSTQPSFLKSLFDGLGFF